MQFSPNAKVYSYVRFSNEKQGRGDSLRRQVELSQRFAEKHSLVIDNTVDYHDVGVSAYRGANADQNHSLGKFLNAIQSGVIERGSILLVESFDRMSRQDVLTALARLSMILEAGVTVVTLSDEKIWTIETMKEELPDLIYSLIIMSRANEESRIRSKRLASMWEAKRRNTANRKMTSLCPQWLKLKRDRTGFEIIEDRAKVIRRIFAEAASGISSSMIAEMLNGEGVSRWSYDRPWTKGKRLTNVSPTEFIAR